MPPEPRAIVAGSSPRGGGVRGPVDFGGEDEAVTGQTPGGVGGQLHGDITPADSKVRMVALALGQQRHSGGQGEGGSEVGELELTPQAVVLDRPALVQL